MKIMRKFLMVLAAALTVGGCELYELYETEDTEYDSGSSSGGSTATGSYTYNYTCPGTGTRVSVPIPNRLSATCRSAWEFYARTYGCNDADRFAEAETRKRACP